MLSNVWLNKGLKIKTQKYKIIRSQKRLKIKRNLVMWFGVLGLFVCGCYGLERLVYNLNVRLLLRNDLIDWMNDWLDG